MNNGKWAIIAVAGLLLALVATHSMAATCSCGGRTPASGGGAIGELDNGVAQPGCDCPAATCQSDFCPVHGYVPSSVKLQVIVARDPAALFDELRQQHREMAALMQQILTSRSADRADLYSQFRMALIPHMKAEEATLYAALEQTRAGHMIALEAEEQHHAAADVLGELEATPIGNDRWMARFSVLRDQIARHVAEEEGMVFNQARQALGIDKLNVLFVQFNTQEQYLAGKLKPVVINTTFSGMENEQGMSTTAPYNYSIPNYNSMQYMAPDNSNFDQHMNRMNSLESQSLR